MDKNYKKLFDTKLSNWSNLSEQQQQDAIDELLSLPPIDLDPDTTTRKTATPQEAESILQSLNKDQFNQLLKSINPDF